MSEFKVGQRIWLTGKILGFDDELQLIHIRTDTGWVTTVTYDTVAQEVTAEQAEPLGTCGASETPHTEDACFKQCHRVKHWKPLPVPQSAPKKPGEVESGLTNGDDFGAYYGPAPQDSPLSPLDELEKAAFEGYRCHKSTVVEGLWSYPCAGMVVPLSVASSIVQRQQEEIERLKAELDSGYPTTWAYEAVCAALERVKKERDALTFNEDPKWLKKAVMEAKKRIELEKEVKRLTAENEELKAAQEETRDSNRDA